MAATESRLVTEVRASGRTITGMIAPYHRPADIGGRYRETFEPGSLLPLAEGVRLHIGHPDGTPHSTSMRDMPATGAGEFAEGSARGVTGLLGHWHAPDTAAGDSLLHGIASGTRAALSVGFVPSSSDRWAPDGSTVTRRGAILTHVAAVPAGAHPAAQVVEVRAAELSHAQRMVLAKDGKALPDGSYPCPDAAHVRAAAVLAASGHGDAAAARKLIRKRAGELGMDVTTLPGFGPAASESRTADDEMRDYLRAAHAPAEVRRAARSDGRNALEFLARRRSLIDLQERGYRTWAGVADASAARNELYDRAVRGRVLG